MDKKYHDTLYKVFNTVNSQTMYVCTRCRYKANTRQAYLFHKASIKCNGKNNYFQRHMKMGHKDYFFLRHKHAYTDTILSINDLKIMSV